MVSIDEEEKQKLSNQRIDYTITQIQESRDTILINTTSTFKHKLKFKNPVKELFFIIQRLRKVVDGFFISSFNYDSPNMFINNEYTNYENVKNIQLKLDDSEILNDKTGSVVNLRAVQSGIHHSRTQLFRRYYSYSFALEPERWYPTGQRNFSLVKDQILKIDLHPDSGADRELRVLGLSYNILRVENGIAKTLFNV
jgi:hypothetical protein